jgi:hypothetical protein
MSKKESTENSGQFLKGQSGNPAGRPKGSKNKTTMIKQALEGQLVDQLAVDAGDILAKAINLAKQGDGAMIKLVLDKLLPNARDGSGIDLTKTGGVNIIIKSMDKPTISAERVDDTEESEDGNAKDGEDS